MVDSGSSTRVLKLGNPLRDDTKRAVEGKVFVFTSQKAMLDFQTTCLCIIVVVELFLSCLLISDRSAFRH